MPATNSHAEQLSKYKKKRDFGITSEPSGRVHAKKSRGLKFVIQEHHASRLHYDFRLEWDGVLKSWAVPKGPSMDTHDKRLAVQVEDHPIEYGKFEGVIPEGEYGAGRVYLWDTGVWEPLHDVDEGLRKGHIDFNLKGSRLSGKWSLVRFRPNEKQPQWLLIYHGGGIVKPAASERAEDEGRPLRKVWHSNKVSSAKKSRRGSKESTPGLTTSKPIASIGADRVLPDFVEPELPLLVDHAPEGDEWVHELKFDGYRIQTRLKRTGRATAVELITRTGQNWAHKYPEIAHELQKLKIKNAILDGEIVSLDAEGKSDFQSLQLAMKEEEARNLYYYVFDLLFLDGEDLRDRPLHERKAKLKKLIKAGKSKLLRYSDDVHAAGKQFLQLSCKEGLEGIVSKKADSVYTSGRTRDWVKTKCGHRQEFVIGGYTEPQGARSRFGALLLGVYDEQKLRFVGKCGTGFNSKTIESTYQKLRSYEQDESPFDLKSPRSRDIHWVKPKLVAEVKFSQWTRDQILRVPVFQGLREDKPAAEIKKEIPREAEFKITNANKVLFKDDGVTKGQIAAYYDDPLVKQAMLPLMRHRPLALVRCPNGKSGGCFFQKHVDHVPAGLQNGNHYVALESDLGLLALVQLGAYEIHSWQCQVSDMKHPDQIVMDFDPSPEVGFKEVKKAAIELKEILDRLGLESFLKTTGGKGLHVHIPIAPKYTWEQVKAFTRILAKEMMSRKPGKYTDILSKKQRTGRIFVDYLRNGEGATAVVPYALRARDRSAVAMPIEWSELSRLKSADYFDLKTALKHIRKRKQDPWKGILELKQEINILEGQDEVEGKTFNKDETAISRTKAGRKSNRKGAVRSRGTRAHRTGRRSPRV